MAELLMFLLFIVKHVDPGKIIESTVSGLVVFAVAKRYFSKLEIKFEEKIGAAARDFGKKADEVRTEISGVRSEIHQLNVKIGDVTTGLDMVKKSHDERIARNSFLIKELSIAIEGIKQMLLGMKAKDDQTIIAP